MLNCWEFMKCGREPGGARIDDQGVCSAATEIRCDGVNSGKNAGRICWLVSGTLCGGEVQGVFAQKVCSCMECDFYQLVRKEEALDFRQGSEILPQICDPLEIAHSYEQLHNTHKKLKETQVQLLQAQTKLIRTEKMASLGRLVAGIAHEINTPIGAIYSMNQTLTLSFEQLREELLTTLPADEATYKKIDKYYMLIENAIRVIGSGSERVTGIVSRMRSFSRLDEAELKSADINTGIDDTLNLIGHELTESIVVVRDYEDIGEIDCYPARFNQVAMNLIINAIQSLSGKGTITLRTRHDGNWVAFQVIDTGSGITNEDISKVFDPGFTTKGVRVGTGLGLPICYTIVKEHHGNIDIESEVGVGTTVTIKLPTNLADRLKN